MEVKPSCTSEILEGNVGNKSHLKTSTGEDRFMKSHVGGEQTRLETGNSRGQQVINKVSVSCSGDTPGKLHTGVPAVEHLLSLVAEE